LKKWCAPISKSIRKPTHVVEVLAVVCGIVGPAHRRVAHVVELADLRRALQHLHRVRVVRDLELRARGARRQPCEEHAKSNCVREGPRTGVLVKTPRPRKPRAVKPAAPASKLATAPGPPMLNLRASAHVCADER